MKKKAIYFLFALDPSTFMSSFNEFFTSKNISAKKINSKTTFDISNDCKFNWLSSKKLLFINVKNVKKPIDSVTIKITHMKIFFLIKSNIMQ